MALSLSQRFSLSAAGMIHLKRSASQMIVTPDSRPISIRPETSVGGVQEIMSLALLLNRFKEMFGSPMHYGCY